MIHFDRFTLTNGLRVLVHEDHASPMAVLNVLYDVGARDEDPNKTGFAHLFEHLMFGGSINIPSYDEPLQRVGGENNAFTTNDITNYYIQVPAINVETAFWLESDRMLSLAFSEKSLDVQRNVVSEEFKQRYLNQPYGDVWLNLRPLAYTTHPYKWATIGKELSHIEDATLGDVKAFFKKHYNPSNAILVIAGNVTLEEAKRLTEKWFGPIPAGEHYVRNLAKEPVQQEARTQTIKANVPLDAIYKAYHICGRADAAFYPIDLLSDMLSRGDSSRLYRSLVKEKQLFSEVNAYVTGENDPGLLIVEGKLIKGVSVEKASEAIDAELDRIKTELIPDDELTKVKNKLESTIAFSEMNLLDKAMNLAFFELMGDAAQYNLERDRYQAVTAEQIREQANQIFKPENSSTLYYLANGAN
ncbi:M16 family metallopeptidase [Solitalea koreensis]|uniref:Predicted Zn-dependent peptidase n=1 Tax=Solitalea koreensis TaxID=543615 RepID=A0A521DXL5_9SPHI|nr:pitrilysin family protein [Solitalea koreensis]SMO76459.1 Predicted Zn-dependent peptidase [Solitalea koreensis]